MEARNHGGAGMKDQQELMDEMRIVNRDIGCLTKAYPGMDNPPEIFRAKAKQARRVADIFDELACTKERVA
jgi:hypothetical protein